MNIGLIFIINMMISRLVWTKKKNSTTTNGTAAGNSSSLLYSLEGGVNSTSILQTIGKTALTLVVVYDS